MLCATSAMAEDDDAKDNKIMLTHAEELHQESCTQCHSDQVYTRPDHFVKSIHALKKQVKRCKDSSNATWFDEDTDAVVHYLNTKYYKF